MATVYGKLPAPSLVGMLGKLPNRDSSSGSVAGSLGLCIDLQHLSMIRSHVTATVSVCVVRLAGMLLNKAIRGGFTVGSRGLYSNMQQIGPWQRRRRGGGGAAGLGEPHISLRSSAVVMAGAHLDAVSIFYSGT